MPRVARVVIPGLPHHVTHRGNRRSPIFFCYEDRHRYLAFLVDFAARHELDLRAYCLMPNHVHLLAVPSQIDSLARAIGRAHMMYARWVNARRRWTGHLWANRFYSCPVDPEWSQVVARYIELNPVRAGIVDFPEQYLWSSARAHCHGTDDWVLSPDHSLQIDPRDWQRWLSEGTEEPDAREIRSTTGTGTPLGSREFLEDLEESLGRRLRRRPYGKNVAPS